MPAKLCTKTPVTLWWRSHGGMNVERGGERSTVVSNAVGAPWDRIEPDRTPRTSFVLERPIKSAVEAPYDNHIMAVRSPTTPWERRRENAVKTPYYILFSHDLTALWTILEHRANAVATPCIVWQGFKPWYRIDKLLYNTFVYMYLDYNVYIQGRSMWEWRAGGCPPPPEFSEFCKIPRGNGRQWKSPGYGPDITILLQFSHFSNQCDDADTKKFTSSSERTYRSVGHAYWHTKGILLSFYISFSI